MSTITSLDISASGLTAQRVRMDTIANNIANADTTRTPEGGPYRRQDVVFSAHMEAAGVTDTAAGVDTPQVVADTTAPHEIYNPGHPDADAKGYVAMPNVNTVQEMVNMISATRAYEANVTAMNAAKSMAMKALDIGKG